MILDLVGFISTHFQPKPSHDDPFQIHLSKIPTPNFLKAFTKTLFVDFLVEKKAPAGMSRGHTLVLKSHIFGKFGLKWVAVARCGLKMGGNESHKVQDHF